jgi:hypothetical protein
MSKRVAIAAGICVLSATMGFAQTAKKPMAARRMTKSGVSETLMQRERAMLQSIEKKDWITFKKYVAADSWNLDENGAMSVADFLKATTDPKFDLTIQMKASDMKVVNVDANSKLVTYTLEQKGSMMGQPFPPQVYATTVWVNHGGTWKALFHQESTAAPKK